MPYRKIPFVNGEFYHIYNRGLAKKEIFNNAKDYSHFIKTFFYYQIQSPKPKFSLFRQSELFKLDQTKKIVEIVCYCLMPNHFHLLIKQNVANGITEFMRDFTHSYSKYRNVKYKLELPVFQGTFKAVRIESDEQLLTSRYIHLNPIVSMLVKDLKFYDWSSWGSYVGLNNEPKLQKQIVLNFFKSQDDYQQFVMDQKDYGRTLEILKHAVIDIE